jgi:hypothetical protein
MTVLTCSRFYVTIFLALLLAVYSCTLGSAVATTVALWQCSEVLAEVIYKLCSKEGNEPDVQFRNTNEHSV